MNKRDIEYNKFVKENETVSKEEMNIKFVSHIQSYVIDENNSYHQFRVNSKGDWAIRL